MCDRIMYVLREACELSKYDDDVNCDRCGE